MFISVDFPDPDCPMMARISPLMMSKLTPRIAATARLSRW